MSKSHVYILDDDEDVRDSLVALLGSVGYQATAFATADEFLAKCREREPFCAVVDVRMPGVSGLELLSIMRARQMHVRVVVVTGHGDFDTAVQAMKLGAIDVLLKPFSQEALLRAIGTGTPSVVPEASLPRVGAPAQKSLGDEVRQRLKSLSAREREILDLIVQGKSSREIAAELEISTATVNNHRTQIKTKMGAKTVAHLLALLNTGNSAA